ISNETSFSASVPFVSSSSTIESEKPYYNATAQKNSLNKQKRAEDQLCELNELYNIMSRSQVKKHEALENRGEVIIYDSLGCPFFLLLNLDLPEQMHLCIEFSKAAKKRQNHLKREIEKKYQLVKNAKQFASAFASYFVIISEDDKAKILFGIPAIGRTFKIVQSANEPVEIPGRKQKLIPFVYLTIKPEDSNDSLRNSQLLIFIHSQWLLSTSSLTHIADIMLIIENPVLNNALKTHAPEQSAYNPVEHSMSTFSGKLAGIVLSIDHFGSHLDSNSAIKNIDLAKQNFHYSDYINGKEVIVEYLDEQINLFNKASDISWD
ncbi:11245_t:CDS:2, partial [Gigaspora margarita]